MNTLQNVYNKLSDKTELAKHEIDLSLIDDFRKLLSAATSDYKEFNNAYTKFNDFKKLVIFFGEKYAGNEGKLETLYGQLSKTSKELGLDFNSTKEGKEALSLAGSGDPKIIKSLINKIKSI
jgi:vacuolar-type H+-ATPase subunit C/Vma6